MVVRHRTVLILGVLGCVAAAAQGAPPQGAQAAVLAEPTFPLMPVEFHPANVLVRFVDGAPLAEVDALLKSAGVAEVLHRYSLVPGLCAVRGPEGGVGELIKALSISPLVLYAEPDYIHHAMRVRGGGEMAQSTPYGINLVNAPAAWAMGARGNGVRVADLDTGLDLGHPDLPAPVAQQSFISGQPVQDGNDHGTHTAGTILALDNDIGVVGVAPDADLLVGKVLGDSGSGPTSGIIAGVNWAVSQNAKVVSMSLGGGGFNQSFADACMAARNAGVVVVASSGNAGNSTPNYPASYPGVISVGAVDSGSNLASFSSFGVNVDLAAPGVAVQSTVPRTFAAIWFGSARNTIPLVGSPTIEVSGQVVNCGNGGTPADFPPAVAGKIAHIRRGGQVPPSTANITFNTKATNALAAGAIGVIISDDGRGLGSWTLNISGTFAIPVLGVSQSDGNTLDAAPPGTTATFGFVGGGYASFNGTSMACPHVSGVSALLIGAFPPGAATPDLVEQAMKLTATDLGTPGRDDFFGDGLVNASAALAWLQGQISTCAADIALAGSGAPGKDGLLTGEDFDLFVAAFFGELRNSQNRLIADIATAGSGDLAADDLLTGEDFDAFIGLFFGGCD